jgi:hypothetical protein
MIFRSALIGLALVLAACHDSGTPTPPPASSTGTARVVINFPLANPASSRIRHTNLKLSTLHPVVHSYVSAKTQSVSVVLTSVNGATPATPVSAIVNVVAGSDCAATSSGLSCTILLDAPVGNDGLEVTTFGQASAVGGAISIGDTTVNITAGATADASVELLPVVSSVAVSFTPSSLPITSAGTFTATITTKDVTGDVIGGSDDYYQPLTVTTADLGAHVTSSPTLPATFTSPSQNSITFTYDGAGSAASYSFLVGGTTVNYVFSSTLEHLYVVTQFSDAAVYVYDIQPDGSVTGPSRTIEGSNTTLNRPTSIAVDSLGQVYVVNYGDFPLQGDNVAVFAPGASGNVAPVQTLLQGSQPFFVSEGAGGFLIRSATDDKSAVSVVINYASGINIPNSGPSPDLPPFVEEGANGVSSYLSGPALDGYICVTTSLPEDGGAGGVQCITSPVEWVTGNINPGTAEIVNGVAINTVVCCGGMPNALQFLPSGDLLVAYGASYMQAPAISTFVLPGDPSTAPNIQPIRSITGSNTGLTSPTAIAYDSHGNIYVSDTGNASGAGSVHIYAPMADGNVAPIQQISGLNAPFGIAIGK